MRGVSDDCVSLASLARPLARSKTIIAIVLYGIQTCFEALKFRQ